MVVFNGVLRRPCNFAVQDNGVLISLQDDGGGMAKPYQVKQVLEILDDCGMEP